METREMEVIYQKIGGLLNDLVPEDWDEICLYAEVLDDSTEVYFFFTPEKEKGYIYSNDIP